MLEGGEKQVEEVEIDIQLSLSMWRWNLYWQDKQSHMGGRKSVGERKGEGSTILVS